MYIATAFAVIALVGLPRYGECFTVILVTMLYSPGMPLCLWIGAGGHTCINARMRACTAITKKQCRRNN